MSHPLTAELFVPCEKMSADDGGRPILERALNYVTAPSFPAEQDVAIYVELWGEPFASVNVQARIEAPDGAVVVAPTPECVSLDADGVVTFGMPLGAVPLPAPGVYVASLVHEGRALARRRFRVAVQPSTDTRTA